MTSNQQLEALKLQARRQLTNQGMKVLSMAFIQNVLHIHYKDQRGEIQLKLFELPV
ncbi:hypothetical protein [Nostoc sp. T09]|uniref:hypothetical protein n=1 Tax=Nostoc sp. T09 TaxID=1932621 RepID=UPI0015C517A9|nr:hypothetical protein [Nostoc sp. T09]